MAKESSYSISQSIGASKRLEEISTILNYENFNKSNDNLIKKLNSIGFPIVVLEYVSNEDDAFGETLIGNLDLKKEYLLIPKKGKIEIVPKENPNYYISPRKTLIYNRVNLS